MDQYLTTMKSVVYSSMNTDDNEKTSAKARKDLEEIQLDATEAFRILVLIKGAELEGKGLHRKGLSCLSILKSCYGLTGSRAEVIEAARKLISEYGIL